MTDFEIEYVRMNLDYLKRYYDINISKEDFVYDIDRASMITDSTILNVNYQNVYKKYLKIVANEAYLKNFSFDNYQGVIKSYEKKAFNSLVVYELIMINLLKSSIFEGYNDLPLAEILYAGMRKERYIECITPSNYNLSRYQEFYIKNPILNINSLLDELFIRMHDYKLSKGKDDSLKRMSIIYYYVIDNTSFVEKIKLNKKIKEFLSNLGNELNISKGDVDSKLKELALMPGNYSKSVKNIISIINEKINFIIIRNKAEENENSINNNIIRFKNMIENDQKMEFDFENLIDSEKKEIKMSFDELEGGNKNE